MRTDVQLIVIGSDDDQEKYPALFTSDRLIIKNIKKRGSAGEKSISPAVHARTKNERFRRSGRSAVVTARKQNASPGLMVISRDDQPEVPRA